MNINFNQRYLSTEQNIQNALFSLLGFREYNNISIKEICYEAGINRSSFYAHYQDINDLMMKVEQNLSKSISQIFNPKEEWDELVFVKLFEFLLKNKNFYKAYLSTNEQTFMEKNDFVKYIDLMNKNFSTKYSQDEKLYHMAFFAGGLKAICKSWIQRDCKETPQQMAKIISNEYNLEMKKN